MPKTLLWLDVIEKDEVRGKVEHLTAVGAPALSIKRPIRLTVVEEANMAMVHIVETTW